MAVFVFRHGFTRIYTVFYNTELGSVWYAKHTLPKLTNVSLAEEFHPLPSAEAATRI